jgi:RNA polymerase sigma-70 factor, ECF subfamily
VDVRDDEFDGVLAAARTGDETAAAALFRSVQPRLLRYLRSQEPRVADDLAADTWLAVARGLDTFEGDAAGFRGWIFTIARRQVIEHRRRGLRRRTDVTDPGEFADRGAVDDPAGDVVGSLSAQEAIDLLVRLLTPDQAEVVVLRVVGGLDTATVATMMERSEGWVRVTQHRALRALAGKVDLREIVTP